MAHVGRAVLLHGFMGSRVQMLPFAAALARDLWKVRNYGYESTRFSIQDHATALARDLESIQHDRMAFVTHSFGGVVLRATLSHPDCPPPARKASIVLLAPPLGGSALARRMKTMPRGVKIIAETLMGAHSGQQLRDIEAEMFLTSLGRFPAESRILLVVGDAGGINPFLIAPSDGVVTVEEVISGMHSEHRRMTVRMTHNMLLFAPKVISSALDFLRGNDDIGELIVPETLRPKLMDSEAAKIAETKLLKVPVPPEYVVGDRKKAG